MKKKAIRANVPSLLVFCALSVLLSLTLGTTALRGDIVVTEGVYEKDGSRMPAFVIETDYYKATLVPDRGGRILNLIDKKSNTDIVYDNGYGGLFDDHGGRIYLPYVAEWLVQEAKTAAVRLTCKDEVIYSKTVTFHAHRPVIEVQYNIENRSQEAERLLFRNVLRPAGQPFSGEELYCYSRETGICHADRMPRTDDQAAPWCALVHPPTGMAVVNAFEGDILERLYTWRGSMVAPTYEFMFSPLDPGYKVTANYTWSIVHGLSAVDYGHKTFSMQVDGQWDGKELEAGLAIAATWDAMPDLGLQAEVLRPDRSVIGSARSYSLPIEQLDSPATIDLGKFEGEDSDYVILLLTIKSDVIGAEPIVMEKAFARQGADSAKLLADYRQPVRFVGAPAAKEPLPDWAEDVPYTIQAVESDHKRGYLVFDELGDEAGKHTTGLHFEMARNEPEAFPLRIASLDKSAEVRIEPLAPVGMSLECFIPETMPQTNWGRVFNGYKLNPGETCRIEPGDDRLLYFRLKTLEAPAGQHEGSIRVHVEGADTTEVALNVNVHPVRFPERDLYMVFDVNNLANYLCARKIKGTQYEWDAVLANNYMGDMAAHGVRGQTTRGVNSPDAHYWYNRVIVRENEKPLLDAIKEDPSRFRERTDLPALDFGTTWNWFLDRMMEHGMTHVRIGRSIGDRFFQNHNRITRAIYGETLPSGDLRQSIIHEWYTSELTRYLKERGMARVTMTIGDEIPREKLAWWVQHAWRAIQMGADPGVTQSASTIRNNMAMNLVAPFMKYWIIGTLHKETYEQRREEGIIKPEHWQTTYHSSANHWRPYSNTRGHCGLNPAFFELNSCWIQCYFRWKQGEAIIYPGEEGPISSAAWEGARDGLDDGNLYLLNRFIIAALTDKSQQAEYYERLEKIVGMREDSLVRFSDEMMGVGMVTRMDNYDTNLFRQAKRELLFLLDELVQLVPPQKASVKHGNRILMADGKACFLIPDELPMVALAEAFLEDIAAPLAYEAQPLLSGEPDIEQPLFFVGTLAQLAERLPSLAASPALADLTTAYPPAGEYALRYVSVPAPKPARGKPAVEPAECMLLIAGDEAGAGKGLANLARVVTAPRTQYSHWLPEHWVK